MKSRLILTGIGLVLFYLLFQSSPETATAVKLITGVKCPVVTNTPCASDSMREEYIKLFMAYKRLKEKCALLSNAVDTVFLTTTDTVLRREFTPILGLNTALKPEFRTYKYIEFDSIAIRQAPISKMGPQNQVFAFYGVSNADTPHYGVGYNRFIGNLTIGGYMAYQRSLGVFAGASVGIKF